MASVKFAMLSVFGIVILPYIVQENAYALVSKPELVFGFLFLFRYLRTVVHLVSFWSYRAAPVPDKPSLTPGDVTVILPTVDPENQDFLECIERCVANRPREIIIIAVGKQMAILTRRIVKPFSVKEQPTKITVSWSHVANKRIQVAEAIPLVKTPITVLLDDHVFWRSNGFLKQVLAPFEDPKVGAVGTNKRVRRTDKGFNMRSFWNMIGAIYLERHNFEIRATNAVDGGVFVISGRTSAHRTIILQNPEFLPGFTNETFFFGMFGPLNADDDNYITRFEVRRGWKIKVQYCEESLIETTLGTYPKFLSQCLRWVRTTWRSNSASLFTDRTVWRSQPWCVYAVYVTSFFNFALFYDGALLWTLSRTAFAADNSHAILALIGWMFFTKMIKLAPYFLRETQDLVFLPGYFVFAYFHSLIKLYALLTFWSTNWGGRNLEAINEEGRSQDVDDDESDTEAHTN
jgi:cellulose synthase/poly-beta-1,6-N-acetylglucosamine synthase-like glycosyltransferase